MGAQRVFIITHFMNKIVFLLVIWAFTNMKVFSQSKSYIDAIMNDSTIEVMDVTSQGVRALHASPNLGFGKFRIVAKELNGKDSYFLFPCLDLFIYDYSSSNKKKEWFLSILTQRYKPVSIIEGARFLIKLNNGDIITLIGNEEKSDNIGNLIADDIVYIIDPKFPITETQMDRIIKEGVDKIRIEYISGICEYEFSKSIIDNSLFRAKEKIDSLCIEKEDPMLYKF